MKVLLAGDGDSPDRVNLDSTFRLQNKHIPELGGHPHGRASRNAKLVRSCAAGLMNNPLNSAPPSGTSFNNRRKHPRFKALKLLFHPSDKHAHPVPFRPLMCSGVALRVSCRVLVLSSSSRRRRRSHVLGTL